jgi:hypothetical protein
MMKRLILAAAATAALVLAGCATATPYQPLQPGRTASGGYSERQIEPNRWQVSFSGNSLTSRQTVETYLLFRSAELTLANGYDWFAIVDRHTERDTRVYADPFYDSWGFGGYWGPSWRFYRGGYWGPWGPWGWGGGWSSFDYREVTRYEATAEIFMGRGPKPADDRRAFEARAVVDRLGPTIVRPR